MSLPPGFLDELRNRLSISQVVGRKVMWDTRKSNQGKGDMWAPCPFHQEKSASFHVDDRKGYYYCFGCHAKGDAISFVRETENVGFMEAVEILAREAGMPVPQRDPQAQAKADRRTQLADVMEQAVQFFRLQLKTGGGAAARDYLAGRGQPDGWLDRWEIGFAPDGWQGLWDHLTGKGVSQDLIVGCGLAKESQQGKKPYDTFRNRIMFPIRDARGRCIAFGGRAMDPADKAKYLNSPETELFDKGRSLYNHGPAREAAGKGQPLIVAEGYMDVIALSEAGFGAVVAPLGTAITENQLQMLWRVAPEPIIALDGDTAGLRAAMRLIDLALPLLEAGQSLQFLILPEGLDPDDFVRLQGKKAFHGLLDGAIPLVRMLWDRELFFAEHKTPEQRAGLSKRLNAATSKIHDRIVKQYYREALREFWSEAFRPRNYAPAFKGGKNRKEGASSEAKRSFLSMDIDVFALEDMRERVALALLLRIEGLLDVFLEGIERFEFLSDSHAEIRSTILQAYAERRFVELDQIQQLVGISKVETLVSDPMVKINPAMRRGADFEVAKMTVAELFAKLGAERAHRAELQDVMDEIAELTSDDSLSRLVHANFAKENAGKANGSNQVEFVEAENGVPLSKEEIEGFARLRESMRVK